MSKAELSLVKQTLNCTIYTIQFINKNETEFEEFYLKFTNNAEYNADLIKIVAFINKIADIGAFERFFRPEGRIKDNVCALPTVKSKLRLYCIRLSNKILILGNGDIKRSKKYNDDEKLKGYVLTLQRFEKLILEGTNNGTIEITENTIEAENYFDI